MSTIPTVTEQDIRSLVREQSFQRGQDYFHSDTLFEMRRQDMTLKARCQGSSPGAYHVEVTFNDTEIVGTGCSCPVGCYCKHVVALLLAWQAHPEKFLEQEDIEAILERCDKADLINVITHMLQRNANLESLVRTMLMKDAPVDPQFYRNQVESAFASSGNDYNYYDDDDDWDGGAGAADELETIRESADGFAQRGDYVSAIAAYKAIVTGVIEHYYEYEHESDEDGLHEVVDECVEDFGKWLVGVQGDSTLREQILHILFTIFHFNIQAGGIGFGDEARDLLVEQTTTEERHTIASWLSEAISTRNRAQSDITYRTHWYNGVSFDEEITSDSISRFGTQALGDFLLELEAETLDDEAYLRICRETGRIRDAVERLLELQRVDEAAQEAQQASDFEVLRIADLFVKAGQEVVAQEIVQKRIWKTRDTRLLEWLKEHSAAQNGSTDKLVQVEKQLHEKPTLEGYKEIRRLAAQIGQWEKKRPELLAFLSANQHTELLIQIALDEDDTDEILKIVQSMGSPIKNESSINRIVELVATAEETQPDVAVHFYQRYVAYIIGYRNRQAYELASGFLIKIRALYEKLGKNEVWTRYIARLYERNSNLRALKNVLVAAGL